MMGGTNPFSISGGYLEKPRRENPFSIAPLASPMPDNDPFRKNANMISAMNEVGVPVPERRPPGLSNVLNTVLGAGSKVLDIIDRPRNAVVTALNDMTDGQDDGGAAGVGRNMLSALKGERHTGFRDVMSDWGWDDATNPDGTKKKWYKSLNNSAKGLVGFVGDVLLDPTTYLSFGTTTVAKVGGKEIIKGAAKLGLKETLEASLKEGGEQLAKDTIKTALAKKLGKETLDGVNASTLSGVEDVAKRGFEEASEKLKAIVGDRTKVLSASDGKALPNMGRFGDKLNELDSVAQRGLYDNLDALKRAPSRIRPQDKFNLANDLVSRAGDNLDDVAKASDMVKKLTGKQMLAAKAVADAFGSKVTAVEALTYGRSLGRNAFKDKLSTMLEIGEHELAAKASSEAAEVEVKFANGISHIYNNVTNDVYMKFMGKNIMNISSAGGDALAQTITKIANFNPLAKIIDPVADLLGSTFRTGYVSKSVEKANPARAEQIKQFFETTKAMIQKETGLPKHSLDAVTSVFDDDILTNQKVRQALTYFIERDISDGGFEKAGQNFAAKKWEELASTLSEEELQLVEKGYNQHVMFMSAIKEFDKAFSQYADEVEDEASKAYVRHFYKQSASQVDDIASAMTREQKVGAKTSTQGGFAKDRHFKTLAAAEALTGGKLKAVDDILTVDALRYMESWRVALNQRLGSIMEELANTADDVSRIISKDKREGFVKLPSFGDKYYVHTDVARELKRFTDVFVDDQAMNKWLSFFDSITNIIKTTQTSMNPNFLAKNVFGETFMNWMADVGIDSHMLAQDILSNVGKQKITRVGNRVLHNDNGELKILSDIEKNEWVNDSGIKSTQYKARNANGDVVDLEGNPDVPLIGEKYEDFVTQQLKAAGVKTYKIGGKEMTADQIMRNFYDLGLGWSGITKGNLINNMQSELTQQLPQARGILQNNPVSATFRGMRNVGDWTETWTRLAHMLDRVQKGLSFREAAMDVRKYHVDYRDLTPMERNVFRRIAPYYTYMRKNLPIQLRTMLTQPGKFATIGKLVNMSYGGLQDVNNMPDYAREELAIPLYEDDDGNITYINWGLPITDLARLKYDLGELWQTNVLDMMHPAIKSQFELTANANIGLGGMPIEKFEGEKAQIIPGVGQPVVPKKLDYAMQQLGIVQNIRKTLGEVFTPDNPMKPDSPIPFVLNSVVKTVNPTQVRTSNEYQYAEQLQAYKQQQEQAGVYIPDTETYERIRKVRLNSTLGNPYSIRRN